MKTLYESMEYIADYLKYMSSSNCIGTGSLKANDMAEIVCFIYEIDGEEFIRILTEKYGERLCSRIDSI